MADDEDPKTNPYTAPESESTGWTSTDRVREPKRGPMPPSVLLAVAGAALLAITNGAAALREFVHGAPGPVQCVTAGIGVVVLIGLISGHRLAWQWGRVLVFLAAIVSFFGPIVLISQIVDPVGEDASLLPPLMISVFCLVFWTIYFSLGRLSARRYFRLICPNCGAPAAQAADFFVTRAKCRRCTYTW